MQLSSLMWRSWRRFWRRVRDVLTTTLLALKKWEREEDFADEYLIKSNLYSILGAYQLNVTQRRRGIKFQTGFAMMEMYILGNRRRKAVPFSALRALLTWGSLYSK